MFKPSERSIYFSTLQDDDPALAASVNSLDGSLFNSEDGSLTTKAKTRYDTAFDILEDGIEAERSNEQAYFESLLAETATKLPPEIASNLRQKLNEIFQTTPINYLNFIDLINNILLGANQYKATLKLERQRLKDLDTSMKNLLTEARQNKITEKNKDGTTKVLTEKEVLQRIRNEYLERHQIQEFSKYFSKISSTADVIISQFVNETINTVLHSEELVSKLKDIYNSGGDINRDNTNFTSWLIRQILILVSSDNRMADILENSFDSTSIMSLIDKIGNGYEDLVIENYEDSYGRKNIKAISIDYKNKTYKLSYENLADDIIDNRSKWAEDKNNIFYTALNTSRNKTFQAALKNVQEKEKALEESPEPQKKQALTKLTNAKKELGREGLKIIENTIKRHKKSLRYEVVKNIKDNLMGNSVYVSGPSFSEIIDTIIQQLLAKGDLASFSGPINMKADTIHIRVNDTKFHLSNSILNNMSDDLISSLNDTVTQTIHSNFQDIMKKTKDENKKKLTSLERGQNAYFGAIQEATKQIQETLKDNEELSNTIDQTQVIAKYMENTIIVTETMKTFKTYQNDYGFVNGSIGGDIGEQVSNLALLFNNAGSELTSDEAEWLQIALVNCSPFAMGAGNIGPLEKYLSVLASFAIFDEGAAEVAIIAKTATDQFVATPKLLHLYRLDGLYYPGSFILQRVYNHLKGITDQLSSVNNDGAHIRATASPSIIPKGEPDRATRWSKTFEIASKKKYTSVDITFLSGLLDIAEQLGSFKI